MAYYDKYDTSLYGRRLGLQSGSSNVFGSGRTGERPDFLVGAEDIRKRVSTAETTSLNLPAYGISMLTSAVSSGVYTLDPPVPGVQKWIANQTTGATWYVKTANGETFQSSQGTTFSVLKSTQNVAGTLQLVGLTTSIWGVQTGLSTATFALSTTT